MNEATQEAYELIWKLNPFVSFETITFLHVEGVTNAPTGLHYRGLVDREGLDVAKRNPEVLRLVEVLREERFNE